MGSKISICIVCIANFCRSPVMEHILKQEHDDNKYAFFSVGLNPMHAAGMDERSIKYLDSLGIKNVIHSPKKINKKILNYFDYFIAVDLYVLNQLNSAFPKYINKFKLATAQFNKISISDPYNLDDDGYIDIMKSIKHVSDNIDLDRL